MRSQRSAAMMAAWTLMLGVASGDDAPVPLEKGVRSLVTRAPAKEVRLCSSGESGFRSGGRDLIDR